MGVHYVMQLKIMRVIQLRGCSKIVKSALVYSNHRGTTFTCQKDKLSNHDFLSRRGTGPSFTAAQKNTPIALWAKTNALIENASLVPDLWITAHISDLSSSVYRFGVFPTDSYCHWLGKHWASQGIVIKNGPLIEIILLYSTYFFDL